MKQFFGIFKIVFYQQFIYIHIYSLLIKEDFKNSKKYVS